MRFRIIWLVLALVIFSSEVASAQGWGGYGIKYNKPPSQDSLKKALAQVKDSAQKEKAANAVKSDSIKRLEDSLSKCGCALKQAAEKPAKPAKKAVIRRHKTPPKRTLPDMKPDLHPRVEAVPVQATALGLRVVLIAPRLPLAPPPAEVLHERSFFSRHKGPVILSALAASVITAAIIKNGGLMVQITRVHMY